MRDLLRDYLMRVWVQAGLIGIIFLFIFVGLRSQHYIDVDGALRCLEVYHYPKLFFHGNNHLLYPAYIFYWHKLLTLFGHSAANNPIDFINLSQLLIALAAAGSLAMFYRICHHATNSSLFSSIAVIGYASTRAFFIQATNAAEPMLGLFWSLLAIEITIQALIKKRETWLICAGASFGLAMASYQSMILIGSVALVLCLGWPVATNNQHWRSGYVLLLRAGLLGASTLLSALLIHSLAYCAGGDCSSTAIVERFLFLKGANIYGEIGWQKLLHLIPGLFFNIVPQQYYKDLDDTGKLLLYAFVPVILLGIYKWLSSINYASLNSSEWLSIAGALVGLVTTLIAPFYWMTGYDKLWLQPLALLSFLSAVLIKLAHNSPIRSWLNGIAISVIALILIINLTWVIPATREIEPELESAHQLVRLLKPNDLIITDWDKVGCYYGAFYSRHCQTYSLPSAAEELGAHVLIDLAQQIAATERRGGRVYFLGLLEHNKDDWDRYLLIRGLSYHSFNHYRANSRLIERYQNISLSIYQSSIELTENHSPLSRLINDGASLSSNSF